MNVIALPSIKIHDTTLRDGEQMPGVVFDFREKLLLADKAMEFGVDFIEIMPAVSKTDFKVTKELARKFGNKLTAVCRSRKDDIDIAIDAGALKVTLIAPMSDLHITEKLRITREENLLNSLEMIDYARSHGLLVDFAGEDASRADIGYLKFFLKEVHDKINMFFISDTVGCLTPKSTRELVSQIKSGIDCPLAMHVHNDFGLAVANTIEGILAGAECFSGTFTGIGERAGNAPIEEVSVALKYLYGQPLEVNYRMLKGICDMVQDFSGVSLQKHKSLVGENAFSHSSGIHVDGILKNPRTYEFIEPEAVGHKRKICLGKHSGKKALEYVLREMFPAEAFDSAELGFILKEMKSAIETKKGPFTDNALEEIVSRARSRKMRVSV